MSNVNTVMLVLRVSSTANAVVPAPAPMSTTLTWRCGAKCSVRVEMVSTSSCERKLREAANAWASGAFMTNHLFHLEKLIRKPQDDHRLHIHRCVPTAPPIQRTQLVRTRAIY